MKKLFTIECNGMFWVEEENAVYSVYDFGLKKRTFYNSNGETIEYCRKPIELPDDFWDEDDNNLITSDDSEETLVFNKYGVACADGCLVDENGNEIPDTKLNCEDFYSEDSRYFRFSSLTDEQCASISNCGTAPDILMDIYDTKNRKYVAKGVPECWLDVSFFDGEPEVVLAAVGLVNQYERVWITGKGTVIGEKDKCVTVYDFYQNEDTDKEKFTSRMTEAEIKQHLSQRAEEYLMFMDD